MFLFFVFCVVREGGCDITPRAWPVDVSRSTGAGPSRGGVEGVCVYPGYTHGGGTRMDTEGVHARPSRGRHRVAGYALGGGFRAGSNDC